MTTAYYANVNPELLRWTPLSARDVLEVGCGEGALAAAYRRRNPNVRYTAIEGHAPAAEVARAHVDELVQADFMSLSAGDLEALGRFDVIVLGDVLEHLPDPWLALTRLRSLLRENGWLALSAPNAAHWTVLAELMRGRWPAHDAGLFDRTHLRWFTLDSLHRTLADTGFAITRAAPREFVLNEAQASAWIPMLAESAARAGLDRGAFETRARTLQWVVNARRVDAPAPPERLHVHFAAITPDFLDVRMRLPAAALISDPMLEVSYAERSARLPELAFGTPKVAVVQRLALADTATVRRFVEGATAAGWVLVFELDDHPDLIGQVQRSRVGEQLRWTMAGFHAVQTSTPRLAQVFSELVEEVAVFPNAMLELPVESDRSRLRVFHGALNREGFTGEVAARLGGVAAAHPDVEFVVLHDRAFFERLPAVNKSFERAQSYADYLAQMGRCEIVLSPLEGAPTELFKSDIKFVEASANRAATLASPPVYADTLVPEETGLIAPTLDDWAAQLERLIAEEPLRRRLAQNACAYVSRERMLAAQVPQRAAWYRHLWSERERLAAAAATRLHAPLND